MAKLSAVDRRRFHAAALAEQRHLLRQAIDGMAAGDLVRALDVAVRIRVLVHEGGGKPLLKQLCNNYLELPILHNDVETKREDHADGTFSMRVTMPTGIAFTKGVIGLSTSLTSKTYQLVPLGVWWNSIVLDLPSLGRWKRSEVVLGVAHKEGGAHVDSETSASFKKLIEGEFVQVGFGGPDGPRSLDALSMSRILTGRSGVELLDCLDRNFPPPGTA